MLPGLNLLVRRLLSAVPQMANVIVLTAFVVTAFAVIGLQLFCDEMPGVCSVSGEVCKPRSRFVEHAPETCPPGAGACTRTTTYDGAYVGINTFDTMFWSLLTVFTCITMEASHARGERWACPPRGAGGAPEQRHRPCPRGAPACAGLVGRHVRGDGGHALARGALLCAAHADRRLPHRAALPRCHLRRLHRCARAPCATPRRHALTVAAPRRARAGDPNEEEEGDGGGDGAAGGGLDAHEHSVRDFRPPAEAGRLAIFHAFYEPNDARALDEDGAPIRGGDFDVLKGELEDELLAGGHPPALWRLRALPEALVLGLVALNVGVMALNSYGIPAWRARLYYHVSTPPACSSRARARSRSREWECARQPQRLTRAIRIRPICRPPPQVDTALALVFSAEVGAKLYALSPLHYFYELGPALSAEERMAVRAAKEQAGESSDSGSERAGAQRDATATAMSAAARSAGASRPPTSKLDAFATYGVPCLPAPPASARHARTARALRSPHRAVLSNGRPHRCALTSPPSPHGYGSNLPAAGHRRDGWQVRRGRGRLLPPRCARGLVRGRAAPRPLWPQLWAALLFAVLQAAPRLQAREELEGVGARAPSVRSTLCARQCGR